MLEPHQGVAFLRSAERLDDDVVEPAVVIAAGGVPLGRVTEAPSVVLRTEPTGLVQ